MRCYRDNSVEEAEEFIQRSQTLEGDFEDDQGERGTSFEISYIHGCLFSWSCIGVSRWVNLLRVMCLLSCLF